MISFKQTWKNYGVQQQKHDLTNTNKDLEVVNSILSSNGMWRVLAGFSSRCPSGETAKTEMNVKLPEFNGYLRNNFIGATYDIWMVVQ